MTHIDGDEIVFTYEARMKFDAKSGGYFVTEKNSPNPQNWGPMPHICVQRYLEHAIQIMGYDCQRLTQEMFTRKIWGTHT